MNRFRGVVFAPGEHAKVNLSEGRKINTNTGGPHYYTMAAVKQDIRAE